MQMVGNPPQQFVSFPESLDFLPLGGRLDRAP
jgi:hypothetical protein